MRTTIDRSGRLVVPKALREQIGLLPGAVEIEVDGSALRIRPADALAFEDLGLIDGIPTLPATGATMTDDQVREMRLADQV